MTSFNAAAPEREMNWGPERTSIIAIIALVFALPCFIPGTGIIASLLAVFALVLISGSKGRVGGTGLAVAALVLGLFSTALWTAVGYGAVQAVSFFKQEIVASTAVVITDIQDGQFDKARSRFVKLSAEQLTDERLEAFRAEYKKKFGEFRGAPGTISEIITDYSQLGQVMNKLKSPPQGQNIIPIPLRFENGPVLLMLEFDPNTKSNHTNPPASGTPTGTATTTPPKSGMDVFSFKNLSLISPAGDAVVLIDPKLLPSQSVVELKPGVKIKVNQDPAQQPGAAETPAPQATPAAPAPEKSPAAPK